MPLNSRLGNLSKGWKIFCWSEVKNVRSGQPKADFRECGTPSGHAVYIGDNPKLLFQSAESRRAL